MTTTNIIGYKNIIDIVKYKWVWLSLTILLLLPGIVGMVYASMNNPNHLPLKVGIDFTGGTVLQYSVNHDVSNDSVAKLRKLLSDNKIDASTIQVLSLADNSSTASAEKNASEHIISIRTKFIGEKDKTSIDKITSVVKQDYSDTQLVSVNSIGPTLGKELFKNSMLALLLALGGIVAYLTIRFQLDYAVIALLAMVHDVIFVVGCFALLGIFCNVEVDALFITAVLTVIGFSVHDTIVVFDRIRENLRFLAKKATFDEIVNASVNQTLARSINTSLTTLITLLALYFFGGVTTKNFVLAMVLGIAIGTYSSIFFASMLLAWHRDWEAGKKKKAAVAV